MTAVFATERDATVAAVAEAERAEAMAAGASAARTWPISVHLTPFAPRCADLRIDHPSRWKTFYGLTVDQVVRATLKRLNLAPGACTAAVEGNDTALLANVPPELLKLVSGRPGEPVPHALFWDGVSVEQLTQALNDLTARGWLPPLLQAA